MLPTCCTPSPPPPRPPLGLEGPGEGCSPQGRTLSGNSHCPLRQEKREGQGQCPESGAEASERSETWSRQDWGLGVGKIKGVGDGWH